MSLQVHNSGLGATKPGDRVYRITDGAEIKPGSAQVNADGNIITFSPAQTAASKQVEHLRAELAQVKAAQTVTPGGSFVQTLIKRADASESSFGVDAGGVRIAGYRVSFVVLAAIAAVAWFFLIRKGSPGRAAARRWK
jgi:hypothetical protein